MFGYVRTLAVETLKERPAIIELGWAERSAIIELHVGQAC